MPAKKPNDADDRKQIPFRLRTSNWKRVHIAKIHLEMSMQELMFRAVDDFLRKKKLEGLDREDSQA